MRSIWLPLAFLTMCSSQGWAIYGPSLERTDPAIATQSCREAKFELSAQIVKAMRSQDPADILGVLRGTLREWKSTPKSSSLYPARAFCVHELVPSQLQPGAPFDSPSRSDPTPIVKQFAELGIEYFYYDPDAVWTLRNDPVDLEELATERQDSRWGREAFLMMTRLGWSRGACQEGPDQFREVIKRSERFLKEYPRSEVSDQIRLELANAYATWWNVSQIKPGDGGPDNPESYIAGSREAKRRAVNLYQEYLKMQHPDEKDARRRLRSLQGDPNGKKDYDYWCPDYED